MKLPDANTTPDAGRCTECFNDFGATIELTPDYREYTLYFREARQIDGWGAPRPPAVSPATLYGILFELNTRGETFDIWIDDIGFVAE